MNEFEIIETYFAPLAGEGAFALRDDAAAISPPAGMDLVLTADAIVAGVHFLEGDPPAQIAQKLLRVNLSDLAAKGARPIGYLLTAAWPRRVSEAFIAQFSDGLAADQNEFGIALLGGDTVATPGPLTLNLMAVGAVPTGQMVRRAGARPGDSLYVTGTIGDSGLGLALLQGDLSGVSDGAAEFLIGRYRLPQPRSGLGPDLVGVASACLDISDGLVADAGHMAETSRVEVRIELADMPLSPPAAAAVLEGCVRRERLAVSGDDYELLIACPPARCDELEKRARALGLLLTKIGSIGEGSGVRVLGPGGTDIPFTEGGYHHF